MFGATRIPDRARFQHLVITGGGEAPVLGGNQLCSRDIRSLAQEEGFLNLGISTLDFDFVLKLSVARASSVRSKSVIEISNLLFHLYHTERHRQLSYSNSALLVSTTNFFINITYRV